MITYLIVWVIVLAIAFFFDIELFRILLLLFITLTILLFCFEKIDEECEVLYETKEEITPTIKTECRNGKCDTTYIYRFKE